MQTSTLPPLSAMDHPFRTRRDAVRRCTEGLSLLGDIVTLLSMNTEDHARVLCRCDADVEDATVRATLARRSFDVGRLVKQVYELSGGETSVHAAPTMMRQWARFLEKVVPVEGDFVPEMDRLRKEFGKMREELGATEHLSASSSYDDYSDSDTESTDEEEEEEEDEDEGEGEGASASEEEEEAEQVPVAAPPRRRGRGRHPPAPPPLKEEGKKDAASGKRFGSGSAMRFLQRTVGRQG